MTISGTPEFADAVLERSEDGVVNDLAGGADHKGVTQSEVENDFCSEPGIRAAEDHGKGMLVLNKGRASRSVLVGVQGFAGNKAFVAFAETAPRQGWSQVSRHEPYFTASLL
jgi:hypothetical protein